MQRLILLLATFVGFVAAWPDLPLKTSGRWMVNSKNQNVTYVGLNWQGAAETMLPEGLQYQSIESIVSKIKSLGMNVIRLTYAIGMIDDIYANNPNQTLRNTLINALGQENGTRVFGEVLKANPQFNANTTRLETFDAVAAECNKQQIYVHLDNHVSKATQCCIAGDGNGWFGDTYFNITNWHRGLAYMANHGKSWPNLASMSLRNELRPAIGSSAQYDYSWSSWYTNMVAGANYINGANPDPLIIFSGLNGDHDLGNVVEGRDLGNGTFFDIKSFNFSDKIVFEYHVYDFSNTTTNCSALTAELDGTGYQAMDTSPNTTAKNIAPVLTTEWGFSQDDYTYHGVYAQCLKQYLTSMNAGWMQWVLSGSLYIKWGQQDSDDSWALVNHDWSEWRNNATIFNYTLPFVQKTLAGLENPADTSVFNTTLSAANGTFFATANDTTATNSTANTSATTTAMGSGPTSPASSTTSGVASGTPSNAAAAIGFVSTGTVGILALFWGALPAVL